MKFENEAMKVIDASNEVGRAKTKRLKQVKNSSSNLNVNDQQTRAKHKRWDGGGGSVRRRQSRPTLVKTGGVSWYEQLPENEHLTKPVEVSRDLVTELRSKAENLLKEDVQIYRQTHNQGDFAWIDRVLHGGTLADKMAAYTILLQDSPVHNLNSLDTLLSLVSTKAKRECIMAIDTLKDLFSNNLLPDSRKLSKFEMCPLSKLEKPSSGNKESNNRRLILWHFEDLLKARYSSFLQALETVTHDTVEKTKSKAISAIGQLLANNPEQEQLLLSLLVNKLGDPTGQMAGKVVHALTKLLDEHPNMKAVVAQEIERFLYRPHLKQKAQYYALCCLNQFVLGKNDSQLALHLTKVYLGFFVSCLKKEKSKAKTKQEVAEVDLRLMSATLTGLSRTTPFNTDNNSVLAQHVNSLFGLLHKVPFNIRTQALALLYQVDESGSERFFSALYRSLLDPGLSTSSRQAVYLNLLYRCLRKDPAHLRVLAFIKRIFQVCHSLPPALSCGLLILVGQVFQNRPELSALSDTKPADGQPSLSSDLFQDDSDEEYHDVPEEDEEGAVPVAKQGSQRKSSSWVHLKNKGKHREDVSEYDPMHRNPLYCTGGRSVPCWELLSLTRHFHPSVALFAKNLIAHNNLEYSGDPLQDFTLSHFLERFVFRNPRKPETSDATTSQNKRINVFGKRKLYVPSGARRLAVQSHEYIQQQERHIPEDERFLYDYMVLESQRRKRQKAEDDRDVESVASEDFEAMLDRMEPNSIEEMDFANAVTGPEKRKNKRARNDEEDEDDNEDMDFEDDFENGEDFQKAFEDYEGDLQDFATEDFDTAKEQGSTQISSFKKNKKSKGEDLGGLFASAEQFSGLLEEDFEDGKSTVIQRTTTSAVANKDNAGAKQLAWELKRHSENWRDRKRSFKRGKGRTNR